MTSDLCRSTSLLESIRSSVVKAAPLTDALHPPALLGRQWACQPGSAGPGGEQPAGHGPGRRHLQRSGHGAPRPAGPGGHLLQEAAAGEEAQR